MSLLKPRPDEKKSRDIRQIGLYAAIPGLLLAGPLIGYLIGWWLDGKLGTEPYLAALGVLLGLAAAALEIYEVIKKASATGGNGDDNSDAGT